MSSELRFIKWVKFFARFVDFRTFCWKVKKIKKKTNSDNVHWNVWTNIKMLHARNWNNIFEKKKKKRIPNIRFWIIYILLGISFFSGLLLPNFSLSANHDSWYFYSVARSQPRDHKKASYGAVQKFGSGFRKWGKLVNALHELSIS